MMQALAVIGLGFLGLLALVMVVGIISDVRSYRRVRRSTVDQGPAAPVIPLRHTAQPPKGGGDTAA